MRCRAPAAKIRAAGVAARQALLGLASTKLGVPVASLSVSKGVVSGGAATTTYGELVGGKFLNVTIPASASNILQGAGGSKPVEPVQAGDDRRAADRHPGEGDGGVHVRPQPSPPRDASRPLGAPARPGAVPHGRVREAARRSTRSSIAHIPGAKVIQVGDFVGVVAPKEYSAIQAAEQLKVTWADSPILPGSASRIASSARPTRRARSRRAIASNVGNYNAAFAAAAKTLSASFYASDRGHNPIGPGCAIAD